MKFIEFFKKIIKSIPIFLRSVYLFSTFFVLLLFFITDKLYGLLEKIPILGKLFSLIKKIFVNKMAKSIGFIIDKLESVRQSEVKRMYLIDLAFRNMMVKKARSFVTILGMSVGVGAIVFLLSLGYGVEKLVIDKVAGLNELKTLDISAGQNATISLDSSVFHKISKMTTTDKEIPVISIVGRINYNRATTDILAYAVPRDYLQYGTNMKLTQGRYFANNKSINSGLSMADEEGQVAGVESSIQEVKLGQNVTDKEVDFNILPDKTPSVWNQCSVSPANLLGYTKRVDGGSMSGTEIWGGSYYPFAAGGGLGYDKKAKMYLGEWVKGEVPIYDKKPDGTIVPKLDENGQQEWSVGCIQIPDVHISNSYKFSQVLGVSTSNVLSASDSASASLSASLASATVISSDSAGVQVVLGESTSSAALSPKVLTFKNKPDGEAIVSSGFLNLLGIDEKKAIGTDFQTSFIIVKSLMPNIGSRIMTNEVDYKIIGVVDDPNNTYFYVPFSDIYNLGIKRFSQFKLILKNKDDLPKVRKIIESMGFSTNSTVDTVNQIESLFGNLQIVLAILGMVALGVASLGMFNTLTVSLLERTREIGGMKAIGMISEEVQDLFLAEAMIMGLAGGFGGLILGDLVGWVLSILVSIIAITNGQGFLQLNYLPPLFVTFIIICSFVVGLLTGLYPAYRAKKTSALNALRYE